MKGRGWGAPTFSLLLAPSLPSSLPSSLPPPLLDHTRNRKVLKKRKRQDLLLFLRDEGPRLVDGLEGSSDQREGEDFDTRYGDVENQRRHERGG